MGPSFLSPCGFAATRCLALTRKREERPSHPAYRSITGVTLPCCTAYGMTGGAISPAFPRFPERPGRRERCPPIRAGGSQRRSAMRSTLVLGVVAGLAISSAPAWAQTLPMQATVTAPHVEVRSGPTDKFYPTLELHQGEAVVVIRASTEPGWVEIKPPEGSFNW